ncbi:hypothetical protein [Burkholderia sp. Ac-20353]|uniref:hypothetical protein n=1 Tax=Burkholderia sp. Ac-20353 TaxID=2703894 RepID=UPI00197B49B4|nr:hypothetical protein [Burkholderia sp. Ac-20353]MBN3785714.1 hypothetical protein [Burkholderia sp. Ac-20353]
MKFEAKDPQTQLIEEHARLRKSAASVIDLGNFYKRALDSRLWTNQAAIAQAIGMSKDHVSKALRASKLPDEVIEAVGGKNRISFRVASALEKVIRAVGADVARLRASWLYGGQRMSTADVLSFIASGRHPLASERLVSITVSRSGSFLKIKSPRIEDLITHLPSVEASLEMILRFPPDRRRRQR